ncbi:MAG: DNA-directed RNA polymerase subunit alpha [Parcubacteria group bacterium GW2011_GWA2_38_13b]|nr:MAG: DNA-directed RNA polymerase subunit alpha [Parcubacteria group bacterium GW2011_GWA2_38_13b]
MLNVSLPEKPRVVESKNNTAVIEINGCYPGYGNTLGNSLRRVLISSLPGAAITTVKIQGVKHEFSAIPNVFEDVIQIMLNLKQVRLKVFTDEPVMMTLKVSGEKEVKAEDIKVSSDVEIVNPSLHIASITDKKGELEMELWAGRGVGYVPKETRKMEKLEVGTIALDAIFTPIRKINYKIENMRVGDRTDYNKIIFTIETDGTINPEDAFEYASKKMVEQFSVLAEIEKDGSKKTEKSAVKEGENKDDDKKDKETKKNKEDSSKIKVEDLKLPSKIINILVFNKIKTLGGLIKKEEGDLRAIDGLGDKGIKEIRKAIGYFGSTLK